MSLFAPKPNPPSLFTTPANGQTSSLFGGQSTNTSQPAQSGGLFASAQPAQPTQSTGLFSNLNNQPKQNTGTSLFGNSTQQQPAGTSLLGAPAATTQNQAAGSSLFGGAQPAQPAQPAGLFGQSTNQQQPQNNALTGALSAGLGSSAGVGALNSQTQRELTQSRLQAAGLSSSVREKSVPQQMGTLLQKWDPESSETLLQTYLYNAANPNFAPFYHPAPGESEKEYEAALANKPDSIDGNTWVPVLVRGFKALGERVEFQAKFVQSMQLRLHEMNNSLTAIMNKHSQDLSVRIETAKKQHIAIRARTMRLAVKCQVLRNRGYALDAQEETLRKSLLDLQKQVQDPEFSSREEEIWARMVVLRERARWLEEETKRLGNGAGSATEEASKIPESYLLGAKRVLRDYDAQIQQMTKEMRELQAELAEFQGDKKTEQS